MADPRATKRHKRKADELFSKIVRSRGRCQRCDRQPPDVILQCAHVYSRSYTAIRWDERNALCLCSGCHFWGHKHPVEWTLFIEETLGAKEVRDLLEEARNYGGRIKRVNYQEIITDLQERLKELEAA